MNKTVPMQIFQPILISDKDILHLHRTNKNVSLGLYPQSQKGEVVREIIKFSSPSAVPRDLKWTRPEPDNKENPAANQQSFSTTVWYLLNIVYEENSNWFLLGFDLMT